LGSAVRPEHKDSHTEVCTPSEGVEADHAGSVHDYEATKSMGGPVIASNASVRADAVVNFEGAALDNDPHAEAVGDTDACNVGAGVGLGERRHGVGDVLGCEHE
jgi:hypothetical protein